MKFKQAVIQTLGQNHYKKGLGALRSAHKKRIRVNQPQRITGSLDIDRALQPTLPDQHRWDYGIGLQRGQGQEVVVWVEVHPASYGEVKIVLDKLSSLKAWLMQHAQPLWQLTREYHWVSTNGVNIPPNHPLAKTAAQKGLKGPVNYLRL